jgi:hypothetical protein
VADASEIREHMDVLSADLKVVGKLDRLEGPDRIKLTKHSSPNGQHIILFRCPGSITLINTCT